MMDFSNSAGADTGNGLLPKGLLVFAILNVRGHKDSGSGGKYIDTELTIKEGQPFAGRKTWEKIGDPMHAGNSEAYRKMGSVAISRILECGRNASPSNPEAYKINSYADLDGLVVAIKVGIEDGTDGHDDKNRVADFLTPNPSSSSSKLFQKLVAGDHNLPTAAPIGGAANGFGGAPAQHNGGSGFGNGGFGQGGGGSATSTGFGNQAGNGQAPGATSGFGAGNAGSQSNETAASASPSSADQTPGWLAQAGGQQQG